MRNVDTTYTERKNPGKLLTLVRAILMILRHFAAWAIEELNLGPHAYQAYRSKNWTAKLRTLIELAARRLPAFRTKHPGLRSRIRRHGVDKKAGAAEPPPSFQTFWRSRNSERHANRAEAPPTRRLTDRELLAIALDMRLAGIRSGSLAAVLLVAEGCHRGDTPMFAFLRFSAYCAAGLVVGAIVIYVLAWAIEQLLEIADPWTPEDDDELDRAESAGSQV